MMKDYTAVIDNRFAGLYENEQQALKGLRGVIRKGELAKIYKEQPYSHLIAELTYADIVATGE